MEAVVLHEALLRNWSVGDDWLLLRDAQKVADGGPLDKCSVLEARCH